MSTAALQLVDCPPYRARLRAEACVARYGDAKAKAEFYGADTEHCLGCALGRARANGAVEVGTAAPPVTWSKSIERRLALQAKAPEGRGESTPEQGLCSPLPVPHGDEGPTTAPPSAAEVETMAVKIPNELCPCGCGERVRLGNTYASRSCSGKLRAKQMVDSTCCDCGAATRVPGVRAALPTKCPECRTKKSPDYGPGSSSDPGHWPAGMPHPAAPETASPMPCGHSATDVVTGDEGTAFCGGCEAEARQEAVPPEKGDIDEMRCRWERTEQERLELVDQVAKLKKEKEDLQLQFAKVLSAKWSLPEVDQLSLGYALKVVEFIRRAAA